MLLQPPAATAQRKLWLLTSLRVVNQLIFDSLEPNLLSLYICWRYWGLIARWQPQRDYSFVVGRRLYHNVQNIIENWSHSPSIISARLGTQPADSISIPDGGTSFPLFFHIFQRLLCYTGNMSVLSFCGNVIVFVSNTKAFPINGMSVWLCVTCVRAIWGGQVSFVHWWFVSSFPTALIRLGEHILALKIFTRVEDLPVERTKLLQASSWVLFSVERCLLIPGLVWHCSHKDCE